MNYYIIAAGVVHEGDELLEINGIPVVGKSTDQIGKLMVSVYHVMSCDHMTT